MSDKWDIVLLVKKSANLFQSLALIEMTMKLMTGMKFLAGIRTLSPERHATASCCGGGGGGHTFAERLITGARTWLRRDQPRDQPSGAKRLHE